MHPLIPAIATDVPSPPILPPPTSSIVDSPSPGFTHAHDLDPPDTISGLICDILFHDEAEEFVVGVLRSKGVEYKFTGTVDVYVGATVELVGRWTKHEKYGQQFKITSLKFLRAKDFEGLARYLATNPKFKGIGPVYADRLAKHVGDAAGMDEALAGDLMKLSAAVDVPVSALRTMAEAWKAAESENEIRSFLSGFKLPPRAVTQLLQRIAPDKALAQLQENPYELIDLIPGSSFPGVDSAAQRMGIAADHPGRLRAAWIHIFRQENYDGHTWSTFPDRLDLLTTNLIRVDSNCSMAAILESFRSLLIAEDIVPLGQRRFALHRAMDNEKEILVTCLSHSRTVKAPPSVADLITEALNPVQRAAFDMAMQSPISLICGEAGTGKSFLLSRIHAAFQESGKSVALCAPTGKAAQRIAQLCSSDADTAQTIHRMLCATRDGFRRTTLSYSEQIGQTTVPGYDVILMDECSMLNASLAASVLSRIDFRRTQLVMFGDHRQLPAIGGGNVLGDLLRHRLAPTVVLDTVMRHAGLLKQNCSAILQHQLMPDTGDPTWIVRMMDDPESLSQFLLELVLKELPRRFGLDALKDIQIFTPMNGGLLGVDTLNKMFQHKLHGPTKSGEYHVGDKVIQVVNNYDLGLMNGTTGQVMEVDAKKKKYTIVFDGQKEHRLSGPELRDLKLAYALTVHKGQGSEVPCAVVLCHSVHPNAECCMLYTAATRARYQCVFLGDDLGLNRAVRTTRSTRRRTLLDLFACEWLPGHQ